MQGYGGYGYGMSPYGYSAMMPFGYNAFMGAQAPAFAGYGGFPAAVAPGAGGFAGGRSGGRGRLGQGGFTGGQPSKTAGLVCYPCGGSGWGLGCRLMVNLCNVWVVVRTNCLLPAFLKQPSRPYIWQTYGQVGGAGAQRLTCSRKNNY
eukprot:1160127-Pelagomonas_calceolata.AAC.5